MPGQEPLTTQLYFPGDKWNTLDPILDPEDRGGRGFDSSLLMSVDDPGKYGFTFVVPTKEISLAGFRQYEVSHFLESVCCRYEQTGQTWL